MSEAAEAAPPAMSAGRRGGGSMSQEEGRTAMQAGRLLAKRSLLLEVHSCCLQRTEAHGSSSPERGMEPCSCCSSCCWWCWGWRAPAAACILPLPSALRSSSPSTPRPCLALACSHSTASCRERMTRVRMGYQGHRRGCRGAAPIHIVGASQLLHKSRKPAQCTLYTIPASLRLRCAPPGWSASSG